MSQIIKFDCCFELPHKGIHLNITTAPQYNNVEFSSYYNNEHQVSVCLREKDVDNLIAVLTEFKEQRKVYNT